MNPTFASGSRHWARKWRPARRATSPTTLPARFRSGARSSGTRARGPIELQCVKSCVTVDDVDQASAIDIHIVGLRRGAACSGLRNEITHFARRQRIGDIDDAQSAREPGAVEERVLHVLLEMGRADAPGCGAG